jgi:thioredoxin reductase (NADPH)
MYDLIIIGSGVAGMSASVYASRYKINHLIFGEMPGGQGMLAGTVENYPGYVSIAGPELMQKFIEQVKHYEVEIKQEKVGGLERVKGEEGSGGTFEVKTDKDSYQAKSLILAMGASFRHLNIPGEDKFVGKGVSYCTTCDAPFFKEKVVAVIGGGDAAVTGALHAASFAQKVFIIHRRDEYRAEPTWVEKMRQNEKIEEILSTQVKQILGTDRVESLVLDKPYKGSESLKVDGVFIEIGQVPSSTLVKPLGIDLNEQGYVKVKPLMATKVSGVFAAGDLAAIEGGILFRQFVTAASDGARAAASVYQYLHQGKTPTPSWGKK